MCGNPFPIFSARGVPTLQLLRAPRQGPSQYIFSARTNTLKLLARNCTRFVRGRVVGPNPNNAIFTFPIQYFTRTTPFSATCSIIYNSPLAYPSLQFFYLYLFTSISPSTFLHLSTPIFPPNISPAHLFTLLSRSHLSTYTLPDSSCATSWSPTHPAAASSPPKPPIVVPATPCSPSQQPKSTLPPNAASTTWATAPSEPGEKPKCKADSVTKEPKPALRVA